MVFGTIQGNTPWFFSDLSEVPAMRASIWYRVEYPIVEDAPTPIITFYNKGQNATNLRDRCINTEKHSQLFNNDLAIPLIRKHRENFWCNSVKSKTWNCHGEFQIHDFKPTSYLFSIGYECGDTAGNLEGLEYKVTIFDESNRTRCVDLTRKYPDMGQQNQIDHCKPIYPYAAFLKPLGNTDLQKTSAEIESLLNLTFKGRKQECLSNLETFLCDIILPQCLPEENEILLPCRDTCRSLLNDCSPDSEFNCDYLPLCQERKRVTGTTEENTTWLLSNLSVRHGMTASIEYYIRLIICFLSLALIHHQPVSTTNRANFKF